MYFYQVTASLVSTEWATSVYDLEDRSTQVVISGFEPVNEDHANICRHCNRPGNWMHLYI